MKCSHMVLLVHSSRQTCKHHKQGRQAPLSFEGSSPVEEHNSPAAANHNLDGRNAVIGLEADSGSEAGDHVSPIHCSSRA